MNFWDRFPAAFRKTYPFKLKESEQLPLAGGCGKDMNLGNRMMKKFKNVILIMGVLLSAGLSGCSGRTGQVFDVNGETLTEAETMAYGMVYAKEHNIVDYELLDEKYEGSQTYGEFYKEEFKEEITETLLLAGEAKRDKIALTDEEEQKIKDSTNSIKDEYGEAFLKSLKVQSEDIEKIYELKTLEDAYMKKAAGEDSGDKEQGRESGERYIKVYQVLFRTVEVDEEGMVRSDSEGKAVSLSPEVTAKKKQEAAEFSEKLQTGGEIESLVKEYDNLVTGMEQYLKYEDLKPDYKAAVDKLKEGEVSGVISSDYGYYVIKLLDDNAEDMSKTLSNHASQTAEQEKADTELERLRDTRIGNNAEYLNQELWDGIDIRQFVK